MKSEISQLANNQKLLTIFLEGRMDTAVSQPWSDEINDIVENTPHDALAVDMNALTFISSSGLRIMLGLKKRETNFKLFGLSSEIYEVFDMTGFTKIMTIEKGLRKINVEGCPEIGRGGIGVVYKTAPDTIVKVFREGTPIEELEHERIMSQEAFVLGMPTAISFDTVRVGNQYGLVYEMLNASTLAALINEHPEKTDEYARQFAQLVRSLHAIEVKEGGIIPNAHEIEAKELDKITCYFSEEEVDRLRKLLRAIPVKHALLHCDLHPKNVMVQNGEMMFIDMGEVGYGHPMMDLAHTYSTMMMLVGDYNAIVGFPEEQSHQFYQSFIHAYYEGETEEQVQQHLKEIQLLSLVRKFSWLSLSDSFPEALIAECKANYEQYVAHLDIEAAVNILKAIQ